MPKKNILFRRNASMLYLWKKKTQVVVFVFNFEQLWLLYYNALVYVDIDQGIHKVKLKIACNEKQKKTTWVFFIYKYGKFWRVLPEQKVDLKPLFSKECIHIILQYIYVLFNYVHRLGKEKWSFSFLSQLLSFKQQKPKTSKDANY